MRTEIIQQERRDACLNAVMNGVHIVSDGLDHSSRACRAIKGGQCVGYFTVLSDYDSATDSFGVGWEIRTRAGDVECIAVYDRILRNIFGVEPSP